MAHERGVRRRAVLGGIGIRESWPGQVVSILYGADPRVLDWEPLCGMEVLDKGLDTGHVVGAEGRKGFLAAVCGRGGYIAGLWEEVKMPELWTDRLTPTREDRLDSRVPHDHHCLREGDGEACIADRPDADKGLCEFWHDVASAWELIGEVRDLMLGRG